MRLTPTKYKMFKGSCVLGATFLLVIMVLMGLREAVFLVTDKWGAIFAWWASLPGCDRPLALGGIITLFVLLLLAVGIISWLAHKAMEFVRIVYLDLDQKAS